MDDIGAAARILHALGLHAGKSSSSEDEDDTNAEEELMQNYVRELTERARQNALPSAITGIFPPAKSEATNPPARDGHLISLIPRGDRDVLPITLRLGTFWPGVIASE